MALSMDEQRMLAEIERRLAAEDPGLATKMTSFRRPKPVVGLRSTRGKIIASLCAVVVLAAISVMVYATIAVRAHSLKPPQSSTSQSASSSAGVKAAPTARAIIGENNVPAHNG